MIFALFAFGYVFGLVGLLLAVPLAAACRVLLHYALEQYYASPLYAAQPNAAEPEVTALAETKPSIKKTG
jgi:predicted PurR-regulated permease PerM